MRIKTFYLLCLLFATQYKRIHAMDRSDKGHKCGTAPSPLPDDPYAPHTLFNEAVDSNPKYKKQVFLSRAAYP
ncbi:hypothetical protein GJ496_006289 [Pomphorhynchus laevis]|nr:hypothetical protein GJ496_006289 [Pomphorhynchus laevis]